MEIGAYAQQWLWIRPKEAQPIQNQSSMLGADILNDQRNNHGRSLNSRFSLKLLIRW